MERETIRDGVVKMVDELIEEVLSERKSEFDVMKAVIRRKKKGFQNQKKMIIDTTSYSVSGIKKIVDVTPRVKSKKRSRK